MLTNDEKIFIIITGARDIESIWSTKALAKSALLYHAKESKRPASEYTIIERKLNQIKQS